MIDRVNPCFARRAQVRRSLSLKGQKSYSVILITPVGETFHNAFIPHLQKTQYIYTSSIRMNTIELPSVSAFLCIMPFLPEYRQDD